MSTIAHTLVAAGPFAAGWSVHSMWLRRRLDQARRDPLTGLPRRDAFEQKARKLLPEGPSAVVLIDLDGFKVLNDTAGHAAGDAALRAVGSRLTDWNQAAHGALARLGGDEFAAVARCDSPALLPDGLELLHAALCEPIPYEERQLVLGASIGAVWHDGRTVGDLSALLRLADEAMYRAKQTGGDWLITDDSAPAYPTVNGRRSGRLGTHQEHTHTMSTIADDFEEFDDFGDAEEWQPDTGQCDRCLYPDRGPVGPLGLMCACRIGQGAPPEECECGPGLDEGGEVEP